jgi:predicted ATP-dependent endonuclease of OLD family
MTDYSKNTLKVSLTNFQSISEAQLEFVQGINLIIGQSNSGKSAILRAIKGAVLNPSGSQKYIKNGTKGFKVALEYNNNNIEWSREKSPKYKINGEDYLKVGNSNLTNVLDKSGFVLDEANNLMNVESELELPFPFDKNNSELFKLFEKNIFCVSDSTSIIKLIKADEDEANKLKDNAEYELDRVKNKKHALEELESEIDLEKLIKGRNTLAESINNCSKIKLDIQELSGMINISKVLKKDLPKVEVNNELQHSYKALLVDINKLNDIRGVGTILKIEPTTSTPKVLNISEYSELNKAVNQLLQAKELSLILRALEAPRTRVISEEYTSLRQDLSTLSRLREQAQNLQKDIQEKKVLIEKLTEQKSQFKVCPLCGGEINGK